jgi:membrane protein DedA with SNARE-associated domain
MGDCPRGTRLNALVSTLISWGPAGICLLAAVDSAAVPIPGGVDALVVLLAIARPRGAYVAALTAVLGSVIGNCILFTLARRGGRAYLDARTQSGRAARFREWFQRYGLLTVFVPAVLPIPLPMKPFVLSAGAMGVSPAVFVGVVTGARLARYLGLAYLGAQLGVHAEPFLREHAWHLLGLAVLLFAALYLVARVCKRRVQRG